PGFPGSSRWDSSTPRAGTGTDLTPCPPPPSCSSSTWRTSSSSSRLSMVFPPVLSGEQHGRRHGGDTPHQLAHDHGKEHGGIKARREAQVVAEHEGGGHGEGHVNDLAPAVHAAHHLEHGDVVGQGGHHAGGGHVVHAQQAPQLHQGPAEHLGDHIHQG